MAAGPLVVLARLKGEGRWQVRAGEGEVLLDGLGLELGHPASVVFDEKRRVIRLKMNTRFVRSRDEGDEQVLTKPFTLTTAAGPSSWCASASPTNTMPPTPAIMKAIEAVRSPMTPRPAWCWATYSKRRERLPKPSTCASSSTCRAPKKPWWKRLLGG